MILLVFLRHGVVMQKRPLIRSRSSKVIDFNTDRKRVYTIPISDQ